MLLFVVYNAVNVVVNLGLPWCKRNFGFFNLYLDRSIILSDMVLFETFCIDKFFYCCLDRYRFYIYYLFHYFYIYRNVRKIISWILGRFCIPGIKSSLNFFWYLHFYQYVGCLRGLLILLLIFNFHISFWKASLCCSYCFAKLLQFWYYL